MELLSTQVATLTQHIHSTSFQGAQSNRPTTEILYSSISSSHDRIGGSQFASSGSLPRFRDIQNDDLTSVVLRDLGGLAAADRRLETFRRDFVNYFPFVVVPPTVSMEALRYDSPFLFLCIMAVTSFKDPILQRRLGQQIKKQICDRLVMGHEVSIDILQGLLVFVAWYQYFCLPGKHQYFLMLQLCVNMCHELRLDLNEKGKRGLEEAQTQVKARNPAEMRALLGTYCLSSFGNFLGVELTVNPDKVINGVEKTDDHALHIVYGGLLHMSFTTEGFSQRSIDRAIRGNPGPSAED
ncbi:hypothetical protein N7490_002146 [Penicillium lividum]|nr:hypothetical protein N7490_002146 [Penicillium lividum]